MRSTDGCIGAVRSRVTPCASTNIILTVRYDDAREDSGTGEVMAVGCVADHLNERSAWGRYHRPRHCKSSQADVDEPVCASQFKDAAHRTSEDPALLEQVGSHIAAGLCRSFGCERPSTVVVACALCSSIGRTAGTMGWPAAVASTMCSTSDNPKLAAGAAVM